MDSRIRGLSVFRTAISGLMLGIAPLRAGSAQGVSVGGADSLKRLSIEQLTNVQVTSVSRQRELLTEVPSAVQVITGDEIRRSGATNLPEALRLATNLQVAQSTSFDWSVTARGFNTPDLGNGPRANKLLVLIDGRTVYAPLIAGVLWDAQSVLLEDIDRIEVISGPGGALWGANAVNGVINIITRRALETVGGYVAASGGTQPEDAFAARYGARLGAGAALRIYAQRIDRSPNELDAGGDGPDTYAMTQGGFRAGGTSSDGAVRWSVQGDAYGVKEGITPDVGAELDGQNLVARWSRTTSATAQWRVQAYVDRTWRRYPDLFGDEVVTYDVEAVHQFEAGRHGVVWGGGARALRDRVSNGFFVLDPADRTLTRYNVFAQDRIALRSNLSLVAGAKLEHDTYAGFALQPSVRLGWTFRPRQLLWGAVSRAVRAPSRADRDLAVPGAALVPNGAFRAERLVAYELGYRATPVRGLALSLATFYHDYDRLRSLGAGPGGTSITFRNDVEGTSWGAELSVAWQATPRWRLRGGYTHLATDLKTTAPGALTAPESEANDPPDQVLIHSSANIGRHWEFDVIGRAVAALPVDVPRVDSYATFDARLGWRAGALELSLLGQNLAQRRHAEFGTLLVPRTVTVRAAVRW